MLRFRNVFTALFVALACGISSEVYCTEGMEQPILTVLDLRPALNAQFSGSKAYDAAKAVGALQGIVNREKPQLYVIYLPNRMALERGFPIEERCLDLYWYKWMAPRRGSYVGQL